MNCVYLSVGDNLKTNMREEKIFEILAEGGSLAGYRSEIYIDKYNKPSYYFFWKTNEIGLEDNSYMSENNKNFDEHFHIFWKKLLKKFSNLYDLYPDFIHPEYRIQIAKDFRASIPDKTDYNFKNWADKLGIEEYKLLEKDYFDYDFFIEYIKKFKQRMEIFSATWIDFEYKHSDYDTINEFRKELESNFFRKKQAGLYAFFLGNSCIYIGKGKDIQKRLEDHWKASKAINHPSRGEKHRKLFGKYYNETFRVFVTNVDDPFSSKIGEELRKTLENLLQLKYKPKFDYD